MVKAFDVVLYHGMKTGHPCHDGYGGGYAAWRHARSQGRDGILAIGLMRGQPMPADLSAAVRGKRVLMVDFAYDAESMRKLTDICASFVLLDHHKSSMEDLTAPGWHGAGFESAEWCMDKSGALMAWAYLFPGETVPNLIAYISDRDLWTFNLVAAREVASYMQAQTCTFERWERLHRQMEDPAEFALLMRMGGAIETYKSQLVDLVTVDPETIETPLGTVALVNSACLQSEIGERLAKDNAFGVAWWVHGGSLHLSLRSAGSFDVSEIARELGGGGHARAAGARVGMQTQDGLRDPALVVAGAVERLVIRKNPVEVAHVA